MRGSRGCGGGPRHRARRWWSALLLCAATCTPASVHAQWQTEDGGLWGARRCQARNLVSAGLLLGASGLPMLAREDRAAAGLGVLLAGSAVSVTGLALRIRLRSDPGGRDAHERWPEARCQARSLSIRGGIYLVTAIVGAVRLLRLPDDAGTASSRAVAALIGVVPPALVGLVFSIIGLRRLRQLGPRPPEAAPVPLREQAFVVGFPFAF